MAVGSYRQKPGVDWFLLVFAAQATWCLSYGLGLHTSDPLFRVALETATWLGIVWTGIAFLGFALEYTGRPEVIRSRPFVAIVAFGLLSTALLVTNPVHGGYWTEFGIDPVLGVETVSYAFGPWGYLVVAVGSVLVASAVVLLVDTLLSYGPLYRRETAAVALSPLPPGLVLIAWTLGVGPVPQLQLAPLMFVPHVALDAYAFARAEMFERNPTTSRAAERTAIDDLSDPVIALGLDRRIVRLNPAAASLLGVESTADARDDHVDGHLDVPLDDRSGDGRSGNGDGRSGDGDDLSDGGELTVESPRGRRTYAVSTSRLTDPRGTHVGYTVVFPDVTERERRRQQLTVLNRILRHNLRNDAGVAQGYGELLRDRLSEPELRRMADAIARRASALAALGEKAGTVDRLSTDADPIPVSVADEAAAVVTAARERRPDAAVEIDVDPAVADGDPVHLRPTALRAILENVVENALDHHDGAGVERADGGAWVRVDASRTADAVTLAVADDGPGIPEHEVAAVEAGAETSLEHGSGIGLWIVEWAATALGADVEYERRDPKGTRVTVRIPIVDATERDRSDGDEAPDA